MAADTAVAGRYEGKVALVTGGASGIGAATARRLVAEGARVVAGDIGEENLAALAAELGDAVATQRADVTSEDEVAALVALAAERFGRLDVAFNVAGGAKAGPLVDLDADDWDFTVDLCLKGVFLSMKHEARQMLAQGDGGAIVNVSSLNSRVPAFGSGPYCAAKAGAAILSEVGALEWGADGIRVNTISPGLVNTPLTSMVFSTPGVEEAYLDRIPMGAAATPEQIASACLYLGSDDASYVSGVNLFVDGAWATSTYPDMRKLFAGMAAQAAASGD